jgi:O-antigen/teichoic acid export membrane protein
LAVTLAVQLCLIPSFVALSSADVLGKWLIISVIPGYLALVDFGLGAVISTAATARYANGEVEAARALLTAGWRITRLVAVLSLSAAVLLSDWLGRALLGDDSADVRASIVLLALFVAGALYCNYGEARLRVVGAVGRGASMLAVARALDFIGLLVGLLVQPSVLGAAAGQLGGRMLGCLLFAVICGRSAAVVGGRAPHQCLGLQELKVLVLPALSFLLLPLGTALVTQGVVLVVAKQLGAQAVVTLAVARVMTNVIRQVTNVLTNGLLPSVTREMSLGHFRDVTRRLKMAGMVSAGFCAIVAVALALGHAQIMHAWLGTGVARPTLGLLLLFVLTTAADVPWLTMNVMLVGTNQHSIASGAYLVGCALSFAAICLTCSRLGLVAVPIGLLIIDLVVTPVALVYCKRLIREGMKTCSLVS